MHHDQVIISMVVLYYTVVQYTYTICAPGTLVGLWLHVAVPFHGSFLMIDGPTTSNRLRMSETIEPPDFALSRRMLELLRLAKESSDYSLGITVGITVGDVVRGAVEAGLRKGSCHSPKQAFDRLLARIHCQDGCVVGKSSKKIVPASDDWAATILAIHVAGHFSPRETLEMVSLNYRSPE